MFRRANRRAFCSIVLPRWAATSRAITFQWPGGVTVPAPSAQKKTDAVCSAVRPLLSFEPNCLVKLKSRAEEALARAGGPGGRNWEPLVMLQGFTPGHCGRRAGANAGGVGRQSPG